MVFFKGTYFAFPYFVREAMVISGGSFSFCEHVTFTQLLLPCCFVSQSEDFKERQRRKRSPVWDKDYFKLQIMQSCSSIIQ